MEQLIRVPSEPDNGTVLPYRTGLHQRSVHTFEPVQMENKLNERNIKPRVENIFVLLDQTEAMSAQYRGIPLSEYVKEITRRILRTLPMNIFSEQFYVFDDRANESASVQMSRDEVLTHSNTLEGFAVIGTRDLAKAVDKLTEKISGMKTRSAVVLVTSWDQISDDVVESVMRLRQSQHSKSGFVVKGTIEDWTSSNDEGVCIYVVGVGNRMSRTILDGPETCGFSIAGDKIAQPRDTAHFVERAFYLDPADSDGDGIYDYLDRCPATTPGRIVGYDGCDRFEELEGVNGK